MYLKLVYDVMIMQLVDDRKYCALLPQNQQPINTMKIELNIYDDIGNINKGKLHTTTTTE